MKFSVKLFADEMIAEMPPKSPKSSPKAMPASPELERLQTSLPEGLDLSLIHI